MARYNKLIAAIIGVAAALVFDRYGVAWGLPPDWPEMVALVLTPAAVGLIPNQET